MVKLVSTLQMSTPRVTEDPVFDALHSFIMHLITFDLFIQQLIFSVNYQLDIISNYVARETEAQIMCDYGTCHLGQYGFNLKSYKQLQCL